MSLYLHPVGLSPDPLYGRTGKTLPDNAAGLTVYPHACLRAMVEAPVIALLDELSLNVGALNP